MNEVEYSKVVPVMVAALICDVGAVDPSTQKKSLIGVFETLWVANFPTSRPFTLYIKVTDAFGRYTLRARLVQVKGNVPLGEVSGEVVIGDRLASADFLFSLPGVPFPEEGRYEFQVFMNGALLGGAFLDARQRPNA